VTVAGWQCLVSLECSFKGLAIDSRIIEIRLVLREIRMCLMIFSAEIY
jgi:hypothetical protein